MKFPYIIKNNNRLQNVIVFLCIFCMLAIPIVYKEFGTPEGAISKLISSLVYCLPVCFLLISIKKRSIFIILSTLFMIMSFIETIMVVIYDNYIVTGNVLAIMTTTAEESSGFVKASLFALPKALPVILCWLFACCINRGQLNVKKNLISALICTIMSSVFFSYMLFVKWEGQLSALFYAERTIFVTPPYNSIFQSYNAYEQICQRNYIKESNIMSFGATRPTYTEKEAYVLFVGESMRYASLSLAGYDRKTTPLIESLENVVLYSNYYSTSNMTMYSVPQIITRATPDDFILSYKEKSIFKPFKECGFKTYTICSGNILTYEKHLSEGCDSLFCLSQSDDGKFAGIIDSLSNIYDKTFFVVNCEGSHVPYENFDGVHNVYHPNIKDKNVASTDNDARLNAYDNTILYTDFNIYNIIKAIDKPNMQSAFLMVSDHGEDFSQSDGVGRHGGSCNPNKDEYHVPLIVWYSNVWKVNHAQKENNLKEHKDIPVNGDNMFYSVCDVADITISKQYAKPEWSIFSNKLEFHTRKLLTPDGRRIIEVK